MPNNKIIDLDRLSRFKDKLDIELDKKANVDGNYPTMTVGNADNLTPYGEDSGSYDDTPFAFQTTGGSADVSVIAYLRALRGNSVAWNQIAPAFNNVDYGGGQGSTTTFGTDNDVSFTAISQNQTFIKNAVNDTFFANHKYVIKVKAKGTASADVRLLQIYDGSNWSYIAGSDLNASNYKEYSTIVTMNANMTNNSFFRIIQDTRASGWTATTIKDLCIFDLTKMGLDSVTSVVEFNRLFPKPYYEYNAGTLLSCKVNGIKNVGYNAFDGQIESGGINDTTGIVSPNSNNFSSKNYTKVIAGQTYTLEVDNFSDFSWKNIYEYDAQNNYLGYQGKTQNDNTAFTLKPNTSYIKITFYKSGGITIPTNPQIAFHLTWDGSRTGYEPYESETYALPNIELRSAGSAYDELKPDGTLIRRVGVVDLGTLAWNRSGGGIFYYNYLTDAMPPTTNGTLANIVCAKYETVVRNSISDKKIALDTNCSLVVDDSTYSDKDTFKAAMNGVYLFYELDTSTETQDDDYKYQEIQDIDDFGTQEFLYDSDINIPIPQGNDFFYPVDYKAFIDSLGGREDIEYDASELVSISDVESVLTDLGNTVGFGFTNIARNGNGDLKINGLTINKATIDNSITSYNAMYGATSLTSLHCKFLDQERGFATFEIEFVSSATATQTGINIQWSTLNSQFWGWLPHVSDGYMYMTQVACLAGTTKKDCFGHFERIDTNMSLVIRSNENFATSTSYKAWIIIPIY